MTRMEKISAKFAFFLPLISEKNDNGEYKTISVGRVSFWIVFGIAIWVWTTTTGDIQAAHLQMLYITTTYNLMKKASWFGSIKTGDSEMTITHEAEDERPPRI